MSNRELVDFFENKRKSGMISSEDFFRALEEKKNQATKNKKNLLNTIAGLERAREEKRVKRFKDYPYNPPYAVLSEIRILTVKINKARKILKNMGLQ